MRSAPSYDIREVADIVRHFGKVKPKAPAVSFGETTHSYTKLDHETSRLAQALLAKGFRAGDRIAYLGKNTDFFTQLYFACAKSQVTLVPLNWRLTAFELQQILADSGAKLLFHTPEYAATSRELQGLIDGLDLVALSADDDPGTITEWVGDSPDTDPRLAVDGSAIVIQIYTSGTTGRPKGVQLSNDNIVASLKSGDAGAYGPWSDNETALMCLPFFHVGGAQSGLHILHHGGHMVIVADAHPDTIFDAFEKWPLNRMGVVPSVLQFCLEHERCAKMDFSRLRTITYGGSPISESVFRRAKAVFGCDLIQLFAMTETASVGTVLSTEDFETGSTERQRSVGRAAPLMDVKIVREDGTDAGPREIGEIVVRGAPVFAGYWGMEEETRHAKRGGWFHTGDAGYADEEGFLYVHDRIKDMVVTGGENVFPAEVENVLADCPGVSDVAVIGVPDERWGEAVKAIVVKAPDSQLSQADLLAFARKRLAGYKIPKSIDFADALPRNAAGKILKRVLREPYWANNSRQVN
ncbi:long-chain-fatty-acid--CoA ligase [Martelella sp. FOR1707]